MFGKPNYTLVDQPMVDLNEPPEFMFMAKLISPKGSPKGKFHGVTLGFRNCDTVKQGDGYGVRVNYDLIAVPEELKPELTNLQNKTGKVWKQLSKEINKVVSLFVAQSFAEIQGEQDAARAESREGRIILPG